MLFRFPKPALAVRDTPAELQLSSPALRQSYLETPRVQSATLTGRTENSAHAPEVSHCRSLSRCTTRCRSTRSSVTTEAPRLLLSLLKPFRPQCHLESLTDSQKRHLEVASEKYEAGQLPPTAEASSAETSRSIHQLLGQIYLETRHPRPLAMHRDSPL